MMERRDATATVDPESGHDRVNVCMSPGKLVLDASGSVLCLIQEAISSA